MLVRYIVQQLEKILLDQLLHWTHLPSTEVVVSHKCGGGGKRKERPVAHSKKSHFFQEAVQKTTEWVIEDCTGDSVMFCKCGKICKEAFNLCEECIATGKLHEAGGYLYLKRDQNNLDRYWFQLINKELYCMVPRSISFTNRL
jgi:hypothetical protein